MFSFLKKKDTDTSDTKDSIKLKSLASKPEKEITTMVNYLKDIVDDENNYNIGITGSYGSGKSSIIKSYEKQNNKKLLCISLAILNENDNNDTNNNQDVSPLEERLEKAIVNQIVHQIDPSYIPQSFLKSKKEKKYCLNAVFMSIGILLLLLNIPASYNYIANIIPDTLLFILEDLKAYLLAGIIGYVMILLYYIPKKINFSSIVKIKSEFYELEANTNENTNNNSYFDKHLDDILYCISQSKCDAIVFEDIDRFNNQEIFIKLKEINNLLNNRHIFGKSNICKKIPFIYAINDDLFKSSDKTKFFDVVIPVLPYINGDNSAETFDTLFNNEKNIKPDSVVLSILSHYITDMRLLKNIYNEYIIYISILDSDNKFQQHDYNQLFSLIVYKNLYPTDFSKLQFSQGYLYNVINSRSKIVQEQKESLAAQIDKIEDEIKKIENEFLQNKYELDILYSYELNRYRNYPDKALIYALKDNFFPSVHNNNDYNNRLKLINKKNNNKANELRKHLNELNKQIQMIRVSKFSAIIQGIEDINNYIDGQEVENNNLQFIRILLVNDFVNEDYKRYLSHFHQGNTSDKDKNFINSVYAKEQPKYDEELDNIEWIISKINPETLDNNFAVLNYSLLYYLLENYNNELNKLYIKTLELIENYSRDKEKYIFIIGFYKYCLDKDLIKNKDLLNDLYKHKPEFVSDIFLYKTSVASDKYAVIYYSVIKNSNIIDIDDIYYNEDESIKNEISEYISTHSDIFINDYIIKDIYWNYLENFNIIFQDLTHIDKDNLEEGKLERFLSYIFQKDLYKVNENNIDYLVNNYFKLKANEPVQDKSDYEIYLHNLGGKQTVLNEFIKLLNSNKVNSIKFEYSEDIEKLIINNEKVNIDDVINFLEKYDIKIDDISIVRDELWDKLLNSPSLLIKPVWSNIINYYNKYKDDKDKKSNAEAHIKEFLLQHKMQDNLDVNSNKILFTLIIKDEVETEKFLNTIQTFKQCKSIPTDILININNMKALLQNKIFAPTKENFDICYNKYRGAFHYFILNNIQLYIENINSYIISKEQLEHIINVNSIDIDTLFIIVHYYFANNSYAGYRDIKINNTALLKKIFTSELDKTIKIAVFKNNIDVIIKTDSLLLYSLSHLLDNNLYNRIKKLFNHNYKSIRLSQEQFNGSNDILNLLIEKNILEKKEHSQHIELLVSDDDLELFQKK